MLTSSNSKEEIFKSYPAKIRATSLRVSDIGAHGETTPSNRSRITRLFFRCFPFGCCLPHPGIDLFRKQGLDRPGLFELMKEVSGDGGPEGG